MIVGVPAESYPGEQRVALVPPVLPILAKIGVEVLIEPGAGQRAGFPDADFEKRGGRIAADRKAVFKSADLLLQVHAPGANPAEGSREVDSLRSGQTVVGLMDPLGAPETAAALAQKGVTSFALELLPRISRAQAMDALSSMATIAGYKAVLLAATTLNKIYPLMMTAAGTLTPARTLVVGAGVAGLQAIATSRRLGSVVHGYDVRPAVKEQVESLGAKFLELPLDSASAEGAGGYAQAMGEEFYRRQRQLMKKAVADSNVVITTAAIPGQKAPVLLTEDVVSAMHPGSVIVDLAAETGGNCELTRPGETVEAHGVTILGPLNLASTVPHDASQMYARNLTAFLQNLLTNGELQLNLEDEIIRDTVLTHAGEVVNARVRQLLGLPEVSTSTAARSTS